MYKSVVSISLLCAFFTFVFTNDVAGFTGFNEQEVTIRWAGERSVIIHIGDDEFAVRPGRNVTTLLPAETALVVRVETPSATYHAEEFLLVQPGEVSLITLMIAGEHVRITYGEDAETEQTPTEIADSVPEEPTPDEQQEPDANDRFDVYETTRGMMISELDPVFAMELWMIRFFTNMNETNVGSSRGYHGIVYEFTPLALASYSSVTSGSVILGAGYGLQTENLNLTTTVGLPVFNMVTYSGERATDWFITEAARMRFEGSLFFTNRFGLGAAYNIGLHEHAGNSISIGLHMKAN